MGSSEFEAGGPADDDDGRPVEVSDPLLLPPEAEDGAVGVALFGELLGTVDELLPGGELSETTVGNGDEPVSGRVLDVPLFVGVVGAALLLLEAGPVVPLELDRPVLETGEELDALLPLGPPLGGARPLLELVSSPAPEEEGRVESDIELDDGPFEDPGASEDEAFGYPTVVDDSGPVTLEIPADTEDEGTVNVVISVIVMSVICVIDLLVAIVLVKLLVTVLGRLVTTPLLDLNVGTGATDVCELSVKVSITVLVRSVICVVEWFVAIVVTTLLVVVTGKLELTGLALELSTAPDEEELPV